MEHKGRPDAGVRYSEICTNIRTTDEISFRLLGLVPLVSGAVIFGVSLDANFASSPFSILISFFAAIVTFGLFVWELRNIDTCKELIESAKKMEAEDFMYNDNEGPYGSKPDPKKLFGHLPIRKSAAEHLIYLTTIIAWLASGIIALTQYAHLL